MVNTKEPVLALYMLQEGWKISMKLLVWHFLELTERYIKVPVEVQKLGEKWVHMKCNKKKAEKVRMLHEYSVMSSCYDAMHEGNTSRRK